MTASLALCPICASPPMSNAVMCAACGEVLVPPETDPMLGQQVGTYKIIKRLGVGGMGTVYEGLEVNIERRAALKIIHPHLREDAQLSSLLSEARAVNAIGDEGIVDIYGFGALPDGRAYLVMELLEGEVLQDRLTRDKKLPVPTAIELLIALSRALEAAHASGFVHRDLKSANVFIVSRGTRPPFPKLLDFGIVHRVKSGGGEAMGTPTYAAPEQATHTNVGPKADLYALGILAFEMLTGRLPFDADDGAEVLRLQREAPRPNLRPEVDVPEPLESLVKSMMATEPTRRPASAGEIRARLLQIQTSLLPAKPGDAEETVALEAPRRSNVALVFGLSVLVLGGLGALGWSQVNRPTDVIPPVTPVNDPVADAVKKAAADIEGKLETPAQALDALLAAEASFPKRTEWSALRGRISTTLRAAAQRELDANQPDDAVRTLATLARLSPLADDDALLKQAKRAAFATQSGMVRVGDVFIDKYEYPNRAGARPVAQVDWSDAVKLCEGVGKHLCTEQEWEGACRGAAGNAFPYGTKFEKARCVGKDKKVKGAANSGSRSHCATSEGVFDLSGNLAEWTSSPVREGAPQKVIRGGSFKQSDAQLSCDARDYLLPGIGGSAHLGLRCCL